jgi:hypothetical protein
MRDYLKEFNSEVIGDFLVDNDITEILQESSPGTNFPTDDGPPTFYKNLKDYKQESEKWINSLQDQLGWKVLDYILSDGAMDPEEDYTMSYRATTPISHGVVDKYKDTLRDVLDTLGWRVIQWMGVDKDQQLAGPPVAAGIDMKYNARNTKLQISGEKFKSGRPKLNTEKYQPLTKDWWRDELRELIIEGGAYGHMAHPFDDKDLTFKDLKNIIERGLGGQLNREDNVTEKLDGQNLMISWRA